MRPAVMYYAYLLPLGLIMVHNLFVFAMVIRVLMGQGRMAVAQNGKSIFYRV